VRNDLVLGAVPLSAAQRYRTPAQDGGVLADPSFDAIAAQLQDNRAKLDNATVLIDGTPLPEFRRQAIAEIAAAARHYLRAAGEPVPDRSVGPLLMSGHQPELTHVGVLVKTFALNGLARRHGLTPLNLIVDNDTAKNTSMRLAVIERIGNPSDVHLLSLPYDRFEGEAPFEERPILDSELFRTVVDRAMPATRNWGFAPILPEFWSEMLRQWHRTPILGEIVAATRRFWERRWGCQNLEIPLSALCTTNAFQRFARHLLHDLPRFHAIYNECVGAYRKRNGIRSRNHPVPDLARDGDVFEAPFWNMRNGQTRRARLMVRLGEVPIGSSLRSRALITTMFMRLCLADGFIHGIGGAKYDEVTDDIVNRWLGIEAPRFIVVTATLRLPLPRFPSTPGDLHNSRRLLRDLEWNPQRHLTAVAHSNPDARQAVADKARLLGHEPNGKGERRVWFRQLRAATDQLRPFVAEQIEAANRLLERHECEAAANELLMRRDYPWCLFPEPVLRDFCQRLM
jgi:hypothetical protein